jgi:two-component system CheB/CheR fusion protein
MSALTEQPGARGSNNSQFPIVGIGASAGGLEAFTQLFKNLPADPGMAFVLIQHLAPTHESMLTELLSKASSMPVREVKDGMAVAPDNVYIIPPDKEMIIFQGVLHLVPRDEVKGQYMPVDSFLHSLAQDRRNNAIAVILSGTGSDGSMGARAIKGEGGIVLAQDETAKYDGMPRSAIDTGCVDFVLPTAKIADELLRISKHPYPADVRRGEPVQIIPAEENDLNRIFIMLRSAKGVDFTSYKRSTIMRRVNRRMLLQKIEGMKAYVAYLKENPSEIETLYQDILINVTSFFREPEAFETLKRSVFPYIFNKAGVDAPVRIWVPACSTGEESYSIAIALAEYMDSNKISRPVQLFATDIDDIAVEKARKGIYPENISRDVSPERLTRFFEKSGNGYVINKLVREMCIFAKQNMVKDPPFSKIDLISCRNVLIYFSTELQKKTVSILFYALNPNGFLMIGQSETVGEFAGLFSVVDKKHTIYSKKAETLMQIEATVVEPGKEKVVAKKAEAQPKGVFDIQKEADTIVLNKYSPAGFVVNDVMKILQFRGDTSPYLRPAPGQASLDLLKMVSEDLVAELRTLLHQAKKEDIPAKKEGARLKQGKRIKYINIDIVPFQARTSGERCFLVLFEDVGAGLKPAPTKSARTHKGDSQIAPTTDETMQLRQDLAASKAHLNAVTQEYEAANEELRALNEELQSSNEEMQSINEEMETAKEELQSTNEELTTVNDELQSRNEETMQLNNDLFNVLRGVEIPIIILGGELRIRRFNDAAARLLNLIPTDTGRPLSNIRTNIIIPDLEQMVLDVVNTLVVKVKEVQDVEGRWYSLTIRPYKTVDNRIDGVLMTLVNVDDMKRSLLRIKEAYAYANDIVETVREPLLILGPDLKVITANRSFYESFLADPAEIEGRYLYELGNGQWEIPELRKLLQEVLREKKSFSDFEVAVELPVIGRKTMMLNAREIRKEVYYPTPALSLEKEYAGMILLAIEDITERKLLEEEIKHMASFPQMNPNPIIEIESSGNILFHNDAVLETLRKLGAQEDVSLFLPEDISEILTDLEQKKELKYYREVMIKDTIFGEYIHLLLQFNVVRVYAADITDRKKTEEALRKSNTFNQSIIDSSNDCIKLLDLEGRLQYMSPGGQHQLGIRDMEKYLNVPYQEFWKGTDQQASLEAIHKAQQGQIASFQGFCPTVDGTPKWWDVAITPVIGADGKPEHLLAVSRDITKRREAEEALQAISDRYRSYIEVTGALGWTTNAGGEVVEDLPSWRKYTGQTYEEVKGQGWSRAFHPEDLAHALQIWKKAVEGKSSYAVEYRIRRQDGIYRDFMTRGMPVFREDGSVREWVGTCIDITERKKSEEALKTLNLELHSTASDLKAAYKDMESFSYAASHDLRSPLITIEGFSKILLEDHSEKLDDKGKDLLGRISNSAKKMNQLIADLLAFSRISTKEVRKAEFNMEALAQKLINELQPTIAERDIEFEVKQLPSAYGDLPMIGQILLNLLSNAIKFTQKRETAMIEVGGYSENNESVYYVRDNGIGFDMQYSDRLFGLFQRIHSAQEVEGTGIGLVIVKNIIEKHGGRVWAEGKPHVGATFYFTLPGKEG